MFCTEEIANVKVLKYGTGWPVWVALRSLVWVWDTGGDLGTLRGQNRQVGAEQNGPWAPRQWILAHLSQ